MMNVKIWEVRTFKMINEYYDTPASGLNIQERFTLTKGVPEQKIIAYPNTNRLTDESYKILRLFDSRSAIVMAVYQCTSCELFKRVFILNFSPDLDYVIKVGQYPQWDISISKELEKILGEYSSLYKKGLICESQGYGIGAFGYYRRIIEEIIDDMLNSIEEIINNEEGKKKYKMALEQVKLMKNTTDKIKLVKDILPDSLKPNDVNPLSIMHSELSKGLHEMSDDECLKTSEALRTALEFLVKKINEEKDTTKKFTETIEKLLNPQSKEND